MTILFQWLGLADKTEPLALPAGSVRSVMALSLILIFVMTGLFLFTGLSQPAPQRSSGLTKEEIALLPQEQIVAINRTSATTDANTVLYDVEIVHVNPAAEDVAEQILAVISTLVVAVAGFYFGSRSVQAATNSVRRSTESSPSAPKITAISPSPANTAEQIFIFGDNFGEPATGSTIMIRVWPEHLWRR